MAKRLFVPAALLLALISLACEVNVGKDGGISLDIAEGEARDEWTRSYAVAAGGKLEIVNRFGHIELVPAAGSEVQVTVTRQLQGLHAPEEAEAALKEIQMIESVAPDSVRIETPTQQAPGRDKSRQAFLTANYRVSVPSGLGVTLKTENGQITVEKMDIALDARTTNGNVTVRGTSGPLQANTVNGSLNIDLVGALKGDVSVTGVNGGVRLRFASPVDADIELTAVNGGVSVDGDTEKMLTVTQKERTALRGRLNKGGPRITAQIVNGGVRVTSDTR